MKYLTAVKVWRDLVERVSDSPALVSVLGIHRPEGEGYSESYCVICCSECYPGNGCTGWPCSTAKAIQSNV